MASQAPFIPKQAPARTPEVNALVMGRTSEDIASHILKNLLPPLDSRSVIHDNGAGPGPVTQTILELYPANDFTIYATDNNPHMLAGLNAAVQAHKWEATVKTSVVDAQELDFENNTFNYSFSNFLINGLSDPKKAAQHIHRTLIPGGKAIATIYADYPHDLALKAAHSQTRGPDAKLMIKWGSDNEHTDNLKGFLVSGGFAEDDVDVYQKEVVYKVKDLERWVSVLWSFIGMREGPDMWTLEDEEKWDEAVKIGVQGVKDSGLASQDSDGGWNLRFPASIVVGTKR